MREDDKVQLVPRACQHVPHAPGVPGNNARVACERRLHERREGARARGCAPPTPYGEPHCPCPARRAPTEVQAIRAGLADDDSPMTASSAPPTRPHPEPWSSAAGYAVVGRGAGLVFEVDGRFHSILFLTPRSDLRKLGVPPVPFPRMHLHR